MAGFEASSPSLTRVAQDVGSRTVGIWVGVIVAAAGGIVGLANSPTRSVTYAVAILGLTFLVAVTGVRAALMGCALLVLVPGVLGESSLPVSLACVAAIGAITVISKPEMDVRTRGARRSATALILIGVAMLEAVGATGRSGALNVASALAGVYVAAAIVVMLMRSRPALAPSALRALAVLVAALILGYLATWTLGFSQQIASLTFDNRRVDIYFPLALTGQGTLLWDGAPPRLVLLTGEPGLNVFFLIGAAVGVTTIERRRLRWFLLAVLAAGAVVSQSAGAIIALLAGVAAAIFIGLARRGHPFVATALATLGGLLVYRTANQFVDLRAAGSSETVADRGLGQGTLATAGTGNINLITALDRSPTLGLALVAALAIIATVAVRTAAGTFAWVAFAVAAVFAQPSQWQAGAWLILALVMLAEGSRCDPRSTRAVQGELAGRAASQATLASRSSATST